MLSGLVAPGAWAQDEEVMPSPIEVLGPTTVALDDAPDEGAPILLLNTGPEAVIYARPDDPGKVAVGFRPPTCPGVQVFTTDAGGSEGAEPPTAQAVPTGETRELRAIACPGLDTAGAQLSIWGSAGGPVRHVTVTLGTAARDVPPPADLPLRDNANGLTLVRVVCLPGAIPGTAGALTRADSVVAVELEKVREDEADEHDCKTGTVATKVVIDPEKGAGLYSGTIDINGAKDGGEVKVELHERVGIEWFWLLVSAGVAVASAMAWMVRVRRPWGAVYRAIAALRVDVEAAQMILRNACPTAHVKWTVIGPARGQDDPAFDAAIRDAYAGVGLHERILGAPPPSLAEAGEELKRLKELATKYQSAAVGGAALARWLERQRSTTKPSRTHATVNSLLFEPPPDGDVDPITTLATAVSAALATVRDYDSFVSRADKIMREVNNPSALVLEKYLAVRSCLEEADLTIATEKALVETAVDELQRAADAGAQPPAPPLNLRSLVTYGYELNPNACTIAQSPPGESALERVVLPPNKTPAEWFNSVRRTNLRFEIATLIIGAGISLLSAWQTLYVSDYDWGSGGDYLGAFAFAVGTTSAVQVARHLTVGILDK